MICLRQLSAFKKIGQYALHNVTKPLSKEFIQIIKLPDDSVEEILSNFALIPDFISESEEKSLFDELEPKLRRMKYQFDHWDGAIHGFREAEQLKWSNENLNILSRVKSTAFSRQSQLLPHVHVLDLADSGCIRPHIDSVKFCGDTIAGLSLLSDSVMKLERDDDGAEFVALLKRRSLYVMKGVVRYEFKHSILPKEESHLGNVKIEKKRRISVICRNEPQ